MNIAVIGAGSWGTALISVLSQMQKVSWWIRSNKNLIIIYKLNKNANERPYAHLSLSLEEAVVPSRLSTSDIEPESVIPPAV